MVPNRQHTEACFNPECSETQCEDPTHEGQCHRRVLSKSQPGSPSRGLQVGGRGGGQVKVTQGGRGKQDHYRGDIGRLHCSQVIRLTLPCVAGTSWCIAARRARHL